VCVPLTPATERLFDERFFSTLKRGAYFVNVARGRCVDTAALIAALKDGRLAGAALDVTDPEPLPPDHELWRLPNVIITPHDSASSDAAPRRQFLLYRENLRRFAAGEALLSVVDPSLGY
jgi:phosphoglycerate dehydrogenase-like enzyme